MMLAMTAGPVGGSMLAIGALGPVLADPGSSRSRGLVAMGVIGISAGLAGVIGGIIMMRRGKTKIVDQTE